MTDISAQCRVFRELHASGRFVIPNPWDRGSARLLEAMGFQALTTTSSGFAWSIGRSDNHVSLEETLAHLRSIAGAVTVPVNADFEGGFATDPKDVMANIAAAGIRTKSDIAAVVAAVAPKPVNVLVGSDFSTVAELAEAGVRRISVGGALARAARPPICYI